MEGRRASRSLEEHPHPELGRAFTFLLADTEAEAEQAQEDAEFEAYERRYTQRKFEEARQVSFEARTSRSSSPRLEEEEIVEALAVGVRDWGASLPRPETAVAAEATEQEEEEEAPPPRPATTEPTLHQDAEALEEEEEDDAVPSLMAQRLVVQQGIAQFSPVRRPAAQWSAGRLRPVSLARSRARVRKVSEARHRPSSQSRMGPAAVEPVLADKFLTEGLPRTTKDGISTYVWDKSELDRRGIDTAGLDDYPPPALQRRRFREQVTLSPLRLGTLGDTTVTRKLFTDGPELSYKSSFSTRLERGSGIVLNPTVPPEVGPGSYDVQAGTGVHVHRPEKLSPCFSKAGTPDPLEPLRRDKAAAMVEVFTDSALLKPLERHVVSQLKAGPRLKHDSRRYERVTHPQLVAMAMSGYPAHKAPTLVVVERCIKRLIDREYIEIVKESRIRAYRYINYL